MNKEQEAWALMAKATLRAGHGEIFAWSFMRGERDSSTFDCETSRTLHLTREDHPTPVEAWVQYFTEHRSHGEYAGYICGMLAKEERWEDLIKILTTCKPFGWDS